MRYEKEVQQNKEQYEREMRALEYSYRKLIENERSKKLDLEKALELEHRKHEETMRQISEEKLDEVNKLDAENEKQVDNLTEASLKANSNKKLMQAKYQSRRRRSVRSDNNRSVTVTAKKKTMRK